MKTYRFTITELVIVLALLGIMAAVLVPILTGEVKFPEPDKTFYAGGVRVVEECRGGVKYMITDKAITVMMDSRGLPFPC